MFYLFMFVSGEVASHITHQIIPNEIATNVNQKYLQNSTLNIRMIMYDIHVYCVL